jgi:hypothetical protein
VRPGLVARGAHLGVHIITNGAVMTTYLGIPPGMVYNDIRGWYYPHDCVRAMEPFMTDKLETEQTSAPATEPQNPPVQSESGVVEIILDEVETMVFDAAHDARIAKITPVEKLLAETKAVADARYNESILKVLKRHGLNNVPEKYGITLRDNQGNLITPGKFTYIVDPARAPQTERAKVVEKLAVPKTQPSKKR